MTDLTAACMLGQIRDLTETLPARCPTTLRIGPGVLDVLKRAARPVGVLGTHQLPFGVRVVEDDTYPSGMWRIFDQWDDEISDGVIPRMDRGSPVTVDGPTRVAIGSLPRA